MKARFEELFGTIYTSEDIMSNYMEIFDVSENEIDEGFLNLITRQNFDKEDYLNKMESNDVQGSKSKYQDGNQEKQVWPLQDTNIEPPDIFEYIDEIALQNEIEEEREYESEVSEFDDNTNYDNVQEIYELDLYETDLDFIMQDSKSTQNNGFVGITLVSKNDTSITFDLWYKSNNDINNRFRYYDFYSKQWIHIFDSSNPGKSGRHTV